MGLLPALILPLLLLFILLLLLLRLYVLLLVVLVCLLHETRQTRHHILLCELGRTVHSCIVQKIKIKEE